MEIIRKDRGSSSEQETITFESALPRMRHDIINRTRHRENGNTSILCFANPPMMDAVVYESNVQLHSHITNIQEGQSSIIDRTSGEEQPVKKIPSEHHAECTIE